jgi:hypothetical protein
LGFNLPKGVEGGEGKGSQPEHEEHQHSRCHAYPKTENLGMRIQQGGVYLEKGGQEVGEGQ